MNQADYRSTAEVAQALGVSVSTVKRWVDTGVLQAHKTAGGHRKLLLAEVRAFCREAGLPEPDFGGPGTGLQTKSPDFDVLRSALGHSLLAGEGTAVRTMLRQMVEANVSIADVADKLVAPVMQEIGHGWEKERLDVWQEHRATQAVAAALYDVEAILQQRKHRHQPLALGGAPEGDPYILPTLLAELTLLDRGWQAVNLGPNTPVASFIDAAQNLKPKLFWLSVTYLADPEVFLKNHDELYRALEKMRTPLAIGGQCLTTAIRESLRYTTFGDSLNHLAAFADALHPQPRRPRRGRPPKDQS